MQSSAHAGPFSAKALVLGHIALSRASIPNGIRIADGKLHIGVNEGNFLGANLCCTQEELKGILNREERMIMLYCVGFKRPGTDKWMEVDRKIGWSAQSQTEIGIIWRNACECRCEAWMLHKLIG